MTGKTHMAIGIAAALTISSKQPVENQLILVLSSAIGSLIPDLDHPRSKLNQKLLFINNNFYRTLFYIAISGIFTGLYFVIKNKIFMLLALCSCLIGISRHRSFTHSIVGFLLASSIVRMVSLKYGLTLIYSGFVIGYGFHLIADLFTPKGIQLLYPLKTHTSFPITIRTNGKSEKIIFALLNIYCIYMVLFRIRLLEIFQ